MLDVDLHYERAGFALDVAFRQSSPITGVFGPSGAGKTTLLHLIAGLTRPDRGSVSVGGRVLVDTGTGVDLAPHRRRVGLLFQEDRLLPHYSVRGNLRYGERLARDRPPLFDFDAVVNLLELEAFLDRRARQLSGGQQRRVALGRTLLAAPDLLLLDEPLASLETRLRARILAGLRSACDTAGVPVVHVSHDLAEILQITDRLAFVDGGRLVKYGAFRETWHDPTVLDSIHDRGLTNVVPVTVADPSDRFDMSVLRLGSGPPGAGAPAAPASLHARACAAAAGSSIHVSIDPSDIALSAGPVEAISIQNQLPGRVTRTAVHAGRTLVEVDVGHPLIVEVSHKTVAEMNLEPEAAVWCLIKSNAIEGGRR